MSEMGTRGKWAEGKVTTVLKGLDERADTTFYRFPDARAGFRQPAPCDYMLMQAGQMMVIEVKEVDGTNLLPYANYAPDQNARIMKWVHAGAIGFTLIAFKKAVPNYKLKDAKCWRLVPTAALQARPTEPRPGTKRRIGSWDLSSHPLMTLAEATAFLKK